MKIRHKPLPTNVCPECQSHIRPLSDGACPICDHAQSSKFWSKQAIDIFIKVAYNELSFDEAIVELGITSLTIEGIS